MTRRSDKGTASSDGENLVNALIYCRVSSEVQGEGYSLPTQLEACKAYAEERGYHVVQVLEDMYTGTVLDRPSIKELLELLRRHEGNVVLVYDLDRLTRDPDHLAILEQEIEDAGARVEYILGQYADTPEGQLSKSFKAAIAEYENRQRRERSVRGKRGRARAGHVVPKPTVPYGYRYVSEEKRQGRLEIDEAAALVVRRIFDWSAQGATFYQIAQNLNNESVPAPRGGLWRPRTIKLMLQNEVYRGVWQHNTMRRQQKGNRVKFVPLPKEQWIAVPVPPLIDPELWQAAQRAKKEPGRGRRTKPVLLTGHIFCICGRRLTDTAYGEGAYQNYRCPTIQDTPWQPPCVMRSGVHADLLDNAVWEAVERLLLEPQMLKTELQRRKQHAGAGRDKLEQLVRSHTAKCAAIERQIEALLDLLLAGEITAEELDKKHQRLTQKLQAAEAQKRAAAAERDAYKERDLAGFQELVDQVRTAIGNTDFESRRRVLALLELRVDTVRRTESEDEFRIGTVLGLPLISITVPRRRRPRQKPPQREQRNNQH